MSDANDLETELSPEEIKAFWRSIDERMRRLDRGRAVFDIEMSEAYRTDIGGHTVVPDRCRIVYQRAKEEVWQITVYDESGNVVCDHASDGTWIDAGDKCWHKGYRYGCREGFDERHELSRAEQEEREDAREPLEHELDDLLWPLYLATEHLFLDVPLLVFLYPRDYYYLRDHWQIRRTQDSGKVLYRFETEYSPTSFRFSAWEVFQWKLMRLWRPSVDIQDYFDRKSFPQTQYEILFNEFTGFAPERFETSSLTDSPEAETRVQIWEAPTKMDGVRFVPRVYTSGPSTQNGEPHVRSTLIVEESAFGLNVPLNIRPVDRTKERVNW